MWEGWGTQYIFLQAQGTAAAEKGTVGNNKFTATTAFPPSYAPSHGELGAVQSSSSLLPLTPSSPTSSSAGWPLRCVCCRAWELFLSN